MSIPKATLTKDGRIRTVFATNPIKRHLDTGWTLVELIDPLNRTGLTAKGAAEVVAVTAHNVSDTEQAPPPPSAKSGQSTDKRGPGRPRKQ